MAECVGRFQDWRWPVAELKAASVSSNEFGTLCEHAAVPTHSCSLEYRVCRIFTGHVGAGQKTPVRNHLPEEAI